MQLDQLEGCSRELVTAAKTIADYLRDAPKITTAMDIAPDAPSKVQDARQTILNVVGRMQTVLGEPTTFIQQLARHTQLLACVKWLGELQILACIPVGGNVAARDVADMAGVSETHLSRVVRMTATAGFLDEPQPGYISHTPLSASFVTNLAHLDAALFLADTAVPTSLQMASATRSHNDTLVNGSINPLSLTAGSPTAFAVASGTSQTFQAACARQSKLQRQWAAYRWCVGDADDAISELLGRLNWGSLGTQCVVDACAPSTTAARTLATEYPSLRIVVQLCDLARETGPSTPAADSDISTADLPSTITVQKRIHGATQSVQDAAIYILRLECLSHSLAATIQTELRAHLTVLSGNPSATLILALRLLPEPGTVDSHVEAMARLGDLSRLQLTNNGDLELDEVIELVNCIYDATGGLLVVNKLRSTNGLTVAVGVKYQAFSDELTTTAPM